MVLYQPHVKLDEEEAKELKARLENPPKNEKAAQTLREARATHKKNKA